VPDWRPSLVVPRRADVVSKQPCRALAAAAAESWSASVAHDE